ncbi:DUF2202 domain-containing protein [Microbacterium sp.]|uniref:DUF2202 domain-containing protein n=1 Tax=Microbacterium sp. TaxID=51671 RepID=UPI0025D85C54|nr:DUF2202 domain-containing protein [Microbacterium sp.]
MSPTLPRPLSLVALAVAVSALAGCATTTSTAPDPTPTGTSTTAAPETATPAEATSAPEAAPSVQSQLAYLIEEEKLAHDVYITLGDLWGAQIFDNIASSEVSHQEQVSALLPAYAVEDPRVDENGVFTDPALQSLYDELIAKGSQSLADAIEVGITIEQTDIADLTDTIATAPADVVTVLERLLAGSQNHLAAFERQA